MAGVPIVVDACSSLNLFGSGRPAEIVKGATLHLVLLPEIEAEAKHLHGEPDEDGVPTVEPVDWKALLSSGAATSQIFPDEALPALIALASKLTDVDAKCVALANHLKIGLLSDDGKVRRVFSASGGVGLRSTVSIIRVAATALPLDGNSIRKIFNRIRDRARFKPSRKDTDYDWYLSHGR